MNDPADPIGPSDRSGAPPHEPRRTAASATARARRIGGPAAPPSRTDGTDGGHALAHPIPETSAVPAQSDVPPTVASAGRRSRAGRNLGAAIGVGLGLGAVIVVTLLVYRPSFAVVVGIAAGYGCYELGQALRTAGIRIALTPLLAGCVAVLAAAWFAGPNGLVAAVLLTAVAVVAWCLADGAATYRARVGASLFVLLYVPALAGFAVLSAAQPDGAARILAFAVAVVCSDTGGYATGVFLGRHPLAPVVSKGKTWEGFAGSVAFGIAGGVLLLTLTFHRAWWTGVLFGLAIVVTATLGDLGESLLKRDLDIKDMGSLLPGHGGLMDRLDSMLPCAAVGYLLLSLFAPV